MRAGHIAPQLGIDRKLHPGGDKDLFIGQTHLLPDGENVIFRLLRAVGDADPSGEVQEGDVCARLFMHLDGQAEQDLRQRRVIFVGQRVAGQKGMDAEMLDAPLLHHPDGGEELFLGHSIFRLGRVVHDVVADGKEPAGVEAQRHGLGQREERGDDLDIRGVVEV